MNIDKNQIKENTFLKKIVLSLKHPKKIYNKGILIQKAIIQQYYNSTIFKKILKTKSLNCNNKAKTELHSVVCHKHVFMYLIALKSLLRFYNNIKIIVHDDGSLTNKDYKILKEHIKNISIITKDKADNYVNKVLSNRQSSILFRKKDPRAAKVFDFNLFSETKKIIQLDSDTLFFLAPTKLIEWIEKDTKTIFSTYEKDIHYAKEFFIKKEYPSQLNVNIGLFCYYANIMDYNFVNDALPKNTKFKFATDQAIYSLLIYKNRAKFKFNFFDSREYQNKHFFQEKPIFRHYWSSGEGICDEYIQDSKKIINELLEL